MLPDNMPTENFCKNEYIMTKPRRKTKKIAHVPLPARAAKIFEVELTVVAFISNLQTQCSYMVDMSGVSTCYNIVGSCHHYPEVIKKCA